MSGLERLLELPRFGEPGVIERMESFTQGLEMVPTIKVVGSNGKGTTAHMMAQMAMELGKKVGLYTSPHILRVGERIRINGQEIEERGLNYILNWAMDKIAATDGVGRFEALTLAALYHFAQSDVDIAIMEAGLGGRFDPVKVARGDISVLTSIDLEHTAILGQTHEAIATEKTAICKTGDTLISAYGPAENGLPKGVNYIDCSSPALAPMQSNARLSAHAIQHHFKLGHLPDTHGARIPARLHKVSINPPVYIDVAHTKAAIKSVLDHFKGRPISLICGFKNDKNILDIKASFHHLIALQPEPDMMTCDDIISCLQGEHKEACDTIEQALELASARLPENGLILCLGGFNIAGRMLAHHRDVHYDVISL
ncbi:putative Dihydrofolate synthase [Candidatus Terasakiella magnetica]|uniref:Dihydrofolate synthase/folylpolyglutamate synthase n=1 Tax=Candidatus Terasakiella magnetica TaxID=1867952 RepID=A0A1C3RIJ5_9PROT|nr:Mur ligase family protein [Candidatus Terasakiella magnetica]SCA57091.1 putative Dihydrofolate synthase [Candidatus Terasakiella magnetica]